MSEDKTQNGYEGSQELDFQDAKEMTVGEAVRKEAEINAGVTETDSILDKYIKQHREEVASQKFQRKLKLMATHHLWMLLFKATSGVCGFRFDWSING